MPLGLLGGGFGVPLLSRTLHPEVIGWFSRVRANGGNASAATLEALSEFCRSVDSLGLRRVFYRLNLFCGSNLSACLVPLYRGPTSQGPHFGHAVDANYNFVASDYTETGASGGLTSSNTKYLITGLAPSDFVPATSGIHMGFSSSRQGQQFGDYIGTDYGSALAVAGVSYYIRQNTGLQVQSGGQISQAGTAAFVPRRFIAATSSTWQNRMVVAGVSGNSFGQIVPPPAGVLAIFGKSASATTVSSPSYMPLGVWQMYSIGSFITPEQSLAIDALLRAFNAALRRDRPSSDPAFSRVGHPEAREWIDNVYANGGTVSTTTASAVNDFCADIDAAGIRDRFFRLNLFAGTGLSACLVPLYRGQSLGGTQFGNSTDTNVNFAAGDYVETGSTGGLLGNGSSKYLNTGLNADALPNLAQSGHLSVYAAGTFSGQIAIGVYNFTNPPFVITHESELQLGATNANTYINSNANGSTPSYTSPAFVVGSRTSTTNHIGYANGVAGTAVTTTANFANPAQPFFVFARNLGGSPSVHLGQRLRSYSIGLGMTGAQVTAFNNATQALQAALGRNV